MNLLIFGATGRTDVTAYVRNASKLTLTHPKLKIVEGNLNETQKIVEAMKGQDAVLVALGQTKGGSKTVMEEAAKAITATMQKTGVRRLITLTGAGVAQPGDEPKAFNKFMSFMLNTFAKDVLKDSAKHADIVRSSPLDWTIVRVPMLTDGEKKGKYRIGKVGVDDGPRISRADVADFMIQQVTDKKYLGQAPVISY
jgi:putative NADH-flavin reductase